VPDLWGVDDEEKVKRIRLNALRKDSFGRRLLSFLLMIFIVSAGVAAFLRYVKIGPGWLGGAISGLAGSSALAFWQRRRLKVLLPGVLAKEGRCTKRGYDLENNVDGICPECGEKISRPKQ
jgi:hypothetical protein